MSNYTVGVRADSLYGEPAAPKVPHAMGALETAVPAGPWSLLPYEGRPPHKCKGNDDTCGANKANGTDYCAGHLKHQEKL